MELNWDNLSYTRSGLIGEETIKAIEENLGDSRAEFAHSLVKELQNATGSYTQASLGIGEALRIIKRIRLYEALGYKTFSEFLASTTLNISERTAQLLIQVTDFVSYLDSIDEPQIASVPYNNADFSKLVKVIKPVKDAIGRKNFDDAALWLRKAMPIHMGGLSRSDLARDLVNAGYSKAEPGQYLALKFDGQKWSVSLVQADLESEEEIDGTVVVKVGKFVRGREVLQGEP